MIRQIPVTPETVSLLQKLQLAPNEGVMAVKFVLLKQATLSAGEAQAKIDSAPSAILLGSLDEMKAQLLSWLDEAIAAYKKE
jgi:hypothetical protein